MRYIHYERVFLVLAVLITLFYSWKSCARAPRSSIRIDEVQHHRGSCNAAADKIEAGTCMVYCRDTLPQVSSHHNINNNIEEYTFVLHNTIFADEKAEKKAASLKKISAGSYTISIENVPHNNESYSVVVHISYPKNMFTVQYKSWEEKNRNKKGLIFYVYNQNVLDTLRNKHEPMLRTVSLQNHPPRIFIDSGHGGEDAGAIGIHCVQEKDVCLDVSLEVASQLCAAGYDVFLSRMTDCDVPLDERTSRANITHADVFISIHANAAPSAQSRGIETYCLSPTLFTDHAKDQGVFDGYRMRQVKQSKQLADFVHKSVCYEAHMLQPNLVDRGVKYTISHVLVGTTMPSILVELGFVTHPDEENLLASPTYRSSLARGISHGVQAYCSFCIKQHTVPV